MDGKRDIAVCLNVYWMKNDPYFLCHFKYIFHHNTLITKHTFYFLNWESRGKKLFFITYRILKNNSG